MARQRLAISCVVLLAAINVSGAQTATRPDSAATARSKRSGNWAATNASGQRFGGTWTAVPDSTGKTVTGTWTFVDAQGRTLSNGGWSAAKSPAQWTGAWRAVVSSTKQESTGTWSSSADLTGGATFAELFEKAAQALVSGTWGAGPQSGAWSIRAATLGPSSP